MCLTQTNAINRSVYTHTHTTPIYIRVHMHTRRNLLWNAYNVCVQASLSGCCELSLYNYKFLVGSFFSFYAVWSNIHRMQDELYVKSEYAVSSFNTSEKREREESWLYFHIGSAMLRRIRKSEGGKEDWQEKPVLIYLSKLAHRFRVQILRRASLF